MAYLEPASRIIFQRDGQMLVTPGAGRERAAAAARQCAQLEAVVAGSYRYRPSQTALWGCAARGLTPAGVIQSLESHGAGAMPAALAATIAEMMSRYGRIRLERGANGRSKIACDDVDLAARFGIDRVDPDDGAAVAAFKLLMAREGWPVVDRRRPPPVDDIAISWRPGVEPRSYQRAAVDAFASAENGIVLLPCGAGKTLVGVGIIVATRSPALILVPSRAVAEQWRRTLLETTTLEEPDIAIVSRGVDVKPVTVATYHGATRGSTGALLSDHPWGIVIYDEVQSLPADVFRLVSAISTPKRLGLSATLVREDGREAEVFAMVGPAIFDVPWVELEGEGWIAPARCHEVRIPEAAGTDHEREIRRRLAYKQAVVERLLYLHRGEPALVVGSDLATLRATARRFDLPLVTGKTEPARREALYRAFREGEIGTLALSRVGSVGLDLPSAGVMVQISGTYGSRQEEAQRLGRLLRPANGKLAHFYTLVSTGTREEGYARRRQRFLVDQGYEYEIVDAADLPRPPR